MTMPLQSRVIDYNANGSVGPYTVPFRFFASTEIAVSLIVSGEETVLALGTHYSVTGGGGASGSITMTVAGAALAVSPKVLRIAGATRIEQNTDYLTNGDFPAESHEKALDRLTAIAQENDDAVADLTSRAVLVAPGEVGWLLPPVAERTGKVRLLGHASDGVLTMLDPAVIAKGDPGGNAMAVGLFTALSLLSIPVGTDLIHTSGYHTVGLGHARYAYNAAVDAAYVAAHPRSSVVTANGRGFKLAETVIDVFKTGAVGNLVIDDSPAFDAAMDALPEDGGTVSAPSCIGYNLQTSVATGTTKPVLFLLGHARFKGPAGDFCFKLQANGSGLIGSGPWASIMQLTAPGSAVAYPSVAFTRSAGAITAMVPSGGSNMKTTPVVLIGNSSEANDILANDAGAVAYRTGSTVTSFGIGAAGAGYTVDPGLTWLGGGAGAVLIDDCQSCIVSGFSVDFQNIPGSVGICHAGGWYAHVSNIAYHYDVATGVSSEHGTSIGLLIDSYTLGAPGPGGAYDAVYVSTYENIIFAKRAVLGHDTSTTTTLKFDTCSFQASYIHATIGGLDNNVVHQANLTDAGHTGDFMDMLNVDGWTSIAGDWEGNSRGLKLRGSCNNIRYQNTLSYSHSGTEYRGQLGPGCEFDFAKSNAVRSFPTRIGSLSAGRAYRNSGFMAQHIHGITYDGGVFIAAASNIWPSAGDKGYLYDVTLPGLWLFTNTSGSFGGRVATAGAGERTATALFDIDAAGMKLPAGRAYHVNGLQVVGARQAALPAAATDLASVIALANALRASANAHGLNG